MDPITEIMTAREAARQQHDPQVDTCFLATVTAAGRPEVRAMSLRDIDPKGFALVLNVTSPKWQQLSTSGQCSLYLYWSTVRRQYRVYGRIEPMQPERLRYYWDRKGRGSRLLEHYYDAVQPQSRPIPSRDYLLHGIQELARRYPDQDTMPIPDTLRGIYLYPTVIDVWHGSPEDRLHDRRLFTRTGAGWSYRTLVP